MNHISFSNKASILQRSVTVAVIFLSSVFATAQADEWNVSKLMSLLAQNKGGHVTFTEKKFISILDMPLVSTGELIFKAPDHLEKRTLTPKVESFVLDGGAITIEHAQQKHVIQLQEYPRIAAFIESIRGTLAGDQTALERSYRLNLTGTIQKWKLTLLPVDQQLTDIINNIQVQGEQDQIRSIEINQVGGDYSIMTIDNPAAS